MSDPLSKSQIERLGVRLAREGTPSETDLEWLHQLLLVRSEVLDRAVARVREGVGLAPTSRVKNTGTIVEKLRRNGGSGLKSMQDLAGIRYGEPPMKWWEPGDVDSVHEAYFTAQYDLRTYTVKWALKVAELISLVEIGEVTALEGSALRSYRRDVNDSLAELRRALRDIDDVDEVASRSRG